MARIVRADGTVVCELLSFRKSVGGVGQGIAVEATAPPEATVALMSGEEFFLESNGKRERFYLDGTDNRSVPTAQGLAMGTVQIRGTALPETG